MISRLKYIFFSTIFLLIILHGCKRTVQRKELYHEGQDIYLDTTCEWLDVDENFYTDRYYPVFYTYYEQKLKEKDYNSMASAMHIVADKEVYYLTFDTVFAATIDDFRKLYAPRLHWSKTLFLETYTGNMLMDRGEFRKAIDCFGKAILHQPVDYSTCHELAYLYTDIAFAYSSIGNQEKALKYNHRALSLFNKIKSVQGKGVVYEYIALVHLFTKNYMEAELYFDKAMSAYKETKDTNNMFISLHNKILLYEETNHPKEYALIDSTYKSFIASGLKDPSIEVSLSNFYVDKLLQEGNQKEAKRVLDRMELLVKQLNSPSSYDEYYISKAQYEIKTGGILNTGLIEEALRAVEESEHFQNQLAFCEVLKANALLHKDYQKALLYSEKEKTALNKLANRDMIVKTMELNKKHQTVRKEEHIVLQQETISKKNITIALLVTALGTFCMVAMIIYSFQKQKKIRVESKRAILYTRQLLEKTEEERKRIAGDLHDSVSHELLNLKNSIHENDEMSNKIDAIINDIRIISRNLHPVMFEKVGLAASIGQLAERTQSVHDMMVTADIEYDGFLSVSDELQVYRMIQEALSNIIKYADAFAAKIVLQTRNDMLYIEIRDNGKGFDVTEKISGSTAFGLHNILERSKALGGSAKIHSDKNGTVITIEIKKRHENSGS